MTKTEIEKQVRDYVAKTFLFGRTESLGPDTLLLGNIIDSTGALELMGFLQRNFSIIMEDEDMTPENLDSLERVSAYVERKLANRS